MINCKLCHSSDVIQIHDKLYSKDSGAVYRCGACDVVFIDPFMSDEESRLFYQNYNDYLVRRGVNVTADPQEDYRVRGPSIQERFENLRGFFAKKSAVCEVGSASGGFLELLHKELDIDTCAVEQNEVNLAFSSKFYKWGYNDIEGMPDDLKFDSICAFHVLEHINRPQDFLENLRKHLKPNGQIVIEVPGADDALLSLYRSKPYADWMYIPIHPFWYSAKSLRYLVECCGFQNVDIRLHNRFGLANHLGWFATGKPRNEHLFSCVTGSVEGTYKQRLIDLGYGDAIYCVANIS